MNNSWIENCIVNLMSMKSRLVNQVFVEEMALVEQGKDGLPVFEHPSCPFIQANPVYLHFDDGECMKICVCQTDEWSICSTLDVDRPQIDNVSREATSIYRRREILDFPKGIVRSVRILQTEGQDIFEVEMTIGIEVVLLKLGEVEEGADTLRIVPNDKSILLFLNADDVERVNFRDPFPIL